MLRFLKLHFSNQNHHHDQSVQSSILYVFIYHHQQHQHSHHHNSYYHRQSQFQLDFPVKVDDMTYYPVVGPIQTMASPADQVSHISMFLIFIFLYSINIVFLDQVTFVVPAFPYFSFSYFPLLICAELYFSSRPFLLFCSVSIFSTDCESFLLLLIL